jgi:hypothetical protein
MIREQKFNFSAKTNIHTIKHIKKRALDVLPSSRNNEENGLTIVPMSSINQAVRRLQLRATMTLQRMVWHCSAYHPKDSFLIQQELRPPFAPN